MLNIIVFLILLLILIMFLNIFYLDKIGKNFMTEIENIKEKIKNEI